MTLEIVLIVFLMGVQLGNWLALWGLIRLLKAGAEQEGGIEM